jgi:hypothetical protein
LNTPARLLVFVLFAFEMSFLFLHAAPPGAV